MDEQEEQPQEQIVTPTHPSKTKLYIEIGVVVLAVTLIGGYFLFQPETQPADSTLPVTSTSINSVDDVEKANGSVDRELFENEQYGFNFHKTEPDKFIWVNADEEYTSDWVLYTNNEFRFAAKYPKDWNVHILNESKQIQGNKICIAESGIDPAITCVLVSESSVLQEISPSSLLYKYYRLSSIKPLILNGIDGVKMVWDNDSNSCILYNYVFKAKMRNYFVNYSSCPGNEKSNRMTEEIANSFRFIE